MTTHGPEEFTDDEPPEGMAIPADVLAHLHRTRDLNSVDRWCAMWDAADAYTRMNMERVARESAAYVANRQRRCSPCQRAWWAVEVGAEWVAEAAGRIADLAAERGGA